MCRLAVEKVCAAYMTWHPRALPALQKPLVEKWVQLLWPGFKGLVQRSKGHSWKKAVQLVYTVSSGPFWLFGVQSRKRRAQLP